MKRTVLFLCTGNYYRSRFAEAVFNHHAGDRLPGWTACSRGLATHMAQGDLARETLEGLRERGIDLAHTAPTRRSLTEADLTEAARVIALHEPEHRPLLHAQFPDWCARTTFWTVADVDQLHPGHALPEIERRVLELIGELAP